MGKTKLFTESENNSGQPGIRFTKESNHRRRQATPGRLYQDQPEAPPLDVLFRQILQRIRRNWIAFRFQANRYTMGLFRQQTAFKVVGLCAVGYWLFFTDREFWIFSRNPLAESVSGLPVETGLDMNKKPVSKPLLREEKSEAAPMSVTGLRAEQSQDYIGRFGKIAVQEMKKYGIPASISLAQGLVESRAGTSVLAQKSNNHFGIKCFSKNCKEGHCSNYADDHHKDFFRNFANPWECWRAHSQMLAGGRYTRLKKYGRDYRKWASGLEQLGYATDPSYSEKLIGVIERYNLQRFDKQ